MAPKWGPLSVVRHVWSPKHCPPRWFPIVDRNVDVFKGSSHKGDLPIASPIVGFPQGMSPKGVTDGGPSTVPPILVQNGVSLKGGPPILVPHVLPQLGFPRWHLNGGPHVGFPNLCPTNCVFHWSPPCWVPEEVFSKEVPPARPPSEAPQRVRQWFTQMGSRNWGPPRGFPEWWSLNDLPAAGVPQCGPQREFPKGGFP